MAKGTQGRGIAPDERRGRARRVLAFAALGVCALGLGGLNARAATPVAAACPPSTAASFADNGAAASIALAKRIRILAIGSSSTLGIGASAPSHAYPAQLAVDLTSLWGVSTEVHNAGVGGEIAATTLARLRTELSSDRPDLIVWQVGTNDAVSGVDLADFRATLEAGVSAARARHVPIILVDPQFFFGIKNLARFEQYVATIGQVGALNHVPVYSRFVRMKAWASQSATGWRALMSPDGFHMGDQGYACLAEALAKDIARESVHESAHVGKAADATKSLAAKM
jgi:lysophospholipase L1-like esterase